MGILKDILFGKTFTYTDEKLGTLRAKIDGDNKETDCLWKGEKNMLGQDHVTAFYLEGTSAGPNKSQLTAIHLLLNDLPEIMLKLDEAVQEESRLIQKFGPDWLRKFYLLDISIEDELENTFLIGLTTLNDENETDIDFEWAGRRVKNLEIEIY